MIDEKIEFEAAAEKATLSDNTAADEVRKARIHKRFHVTRKVLMSLFAVSMMVMCFSMSAAAAPPTFVTNAQDAMKKLVVAIGAGLGVWGVVNLVEGYGNDNPGAKSQGMKQLMAGIALATIGGTLVGSLSSYLT